MNKQQYINSLEKVKIVLGNGFDLHCGLRTSYKDFFNWNFDKYLSIEKHFEKFKESGEFGINFKEKNNGRINTWDLFFVLNKKNNGYFYNYWSDIERLIGASLVSFDPQTSSQETLIKGAGSDVHWNVIQSLLWKDGLGLNDKERFMTIFIKERSKFIKQDYRNFYSFLLAELKEFEKNFGDFIYRQIHDRYLENINHRTDFYNKNYIENAIFTLHELCNDENIVSIDTFNYTTIESPLIKSKIQNVNGNYDNPIFGIDSEFLPNDSQYIFTKTSRRIESDMVEENYDEKPDFKNVIVYGHSLTQPDFSYFFPLFDKLDLTNSTATGVIVFAYSIYDESDRNYLEKKIRTSVSNIILEYAKSKKLSDPKRLLDFLSTQKRVIMLELNNIPCSPFISSSFDEEWSKIDKKINEHNKESV